MRVAFLTNVVSPYRAPLFEELANTAGWRMRVFTNAVSEYDRQWNEVSTELDVRQTRSLSLRRRVITSRPVRCEQVVELHVPLSLWRDLAKFRPDVVISLELGPRTAIAATYCKLHSIPLIAWSYQSRASKTMTGSLRRWLRKWLLRQAIAVVGMGHQAREVLTQFGVDGRRIFDAPNAPARARIAARQRDAAHARSVDQIRERFAGKRIAVVVGRLVPMKAADRIVATWQSLPPAARADWVLLFVGDGPLAPYVSGLEHEGVFHVGHVATDEVPDYLTAASLQIFASLLDVWGLVVTEGMLCGTPALCSTHAGCADDVIDHEVDGWLFDPTDPPGWRRQLTALMCRDDLESIGERARGSASQFSIPAMASGFRNAVHFALSERSTRR